MRIGIIGLGNIGGTLARLWAKAGHDVILSSKDPAKHRDLLDELGSEARLASPEEAAREGEAVLLSIPLGSMPELAGKIGALVKGKTVLDTCNPYPERDGELAEEVIRSGRGVGIWTQSLFPGARVVRAFNSVPARILAHSAHSKMPEPIGVPLASDDEDAIRIAVQLVRDAGFEPVIVGGLDRSKDFDRDTEVYGEGLPASDLAKLLRPTLRAA